MPECTSLRVSITRYTSNNALPYFRMHDRLMEEHCERSCRHCKYVSNALQARSDLLLEKTVRNSDESEVVLES